MGRDRKKEKLIEKAKEKEIESKNKAGHRRGKYDEPNDPRIDA
jgi:hypothetical protein